jgi:TonB family protein
MARSHEAETRQQPSAGPELQEANRLNATVIELFNAKKYDEAIPIAQRVVEIREKMLGTNASSTASAYINLAELYLAKHNYNEAASAYERVFSIYEKVFGVDDLNNATIAESLGLINYLRGEYAKAETFYKKNLAISELRLGPEAKEVAKASLALAEFYRSRREFKPAEPLFLRAIAIDDKALAKTDPELAHVMERYTCFVYESMGVGAGRKHLEEFSRTRRSEPEGTSAGGGVLNGRALSLPTPSYPDEARAARASGIVLVGVTIDTEGRVIDAHAICGPAVFAKVSIAAARNARFSPTKLSGMPVKVNGVIIYNFVAQ